MIPVVLSLTHAAPVAKASGAHRSAQAGTYVATSLNRRAIPAEERVSSSDGYYHWVKVERLILRLQADGRFSVSMRYYHEHLRPKARPTGSQLLDAANRGTYRVSGDQIVFTPASKGGRSPKPVRGSLHGDHIEVTFRVQEGDHWRPMTVIALRDPSYW